MKNIAIIFAGGIGSRMGSKTPKQFLKVYGKEIIIHTLEKFEYNEKIDKIYVGCKEEYIPFLKKLVNKYNISKIDENGILKGGETGQETIYNTLKTALKYNDEDSIVLIHDGVRPLINDEIINNNIENVKKYGSSITCTKSFETPIISKDGIEINEILERNYVYTAKAPQCFKLNEIINAHEIIKKTEEGYNNPKIVDSCSLFKEAGYKVHLTEGNRENIKVTTVEDYISLMAFLMIDDQKQIFKLKEGENHE